MPKVMPMFVKEVGPESKPGPRWFVSGCGEMKITMRPEKMERDPQSGQLFKTPGVYITFERRNKPNEFIGDGHLGNLNPSGKDLNSNRVWGVCELDTTKKEDAVKADFLRRHPHYLHVQTNEAFDVPKLKIIELDWDPAVLPSGAWISGSAVTRHPRIARPGTETAPAAPQDSSAEPQAARVAPMGRSLRKPETSKEA